MEEYNNFFTNKILTVCDNIDKNLILPTNERGFISQNILKRLRDLLEYTFQKIYSSNEAIDINQDEKSVNKNAVKYVKSQGGKFLFLIRFYNMLQKSVSHYTLSENSSERLMLKYFIFLVEIKFFLKDSYNIEILKNLHKFPLNLDKNLTKYYEAIANKIDNQTILNNSDKMSDSYYITNVKPFVVQEKIYYEVTFVKATDKFDKFNKLIAFCNYKILDNYAVDLWISNENIEILDKTIPIRIICDWNVAIRPAELVNFGKIFNFKNKISKTKEYYQLMDYLKQKHINLVDLIDSNDYDFVKNKILSESKTSHIFDILDRARSIKQIGKNTIRYLLCNLHNEIIKKQLCTIENQCISNLNLHRKCYPFETMPFTTSLIDHNPNFYDLLSCIDTTGHEHEIFARAVKNKIENNGSLFVDKNEFEFDDIDNLRERFNKNLWKGNDRNPAGHTGRKIEEFNGYFYIKDYAEKSLEIVESLKKLTQCGIINYSNSVKNWLEDNPNIIDDEDKKKILIKLFEQSKVALIYGAAGTGKTTLINHISNFFADKNKIFLANTHTAVDNLKRRVKNSNNSEFKIIAKFNSEYNKNEECDILIIDECSTISNEDMQKILKKAKFELLILVGDIYQIEAISFGNWFKIAPNFISERAIFELENTFRTKNVKLLNLWKNTRDFSDFICEILQRENYSQKLENLNFQTNDDEIVLCLNYDGLYGINNLNTILQKNNKHDAVEWKLHTYKINDPVLFNQTERFSPLIYNNMKGKIVDIVKKEREIWFSIELEKSINDLEARYYDFELEVRDGKSIIKFCVNEYGSVSEEGEEENDEKTIVPFHVAYAISIHKAQGLEYKSVKVVISSVVDEMITHNIFYTAITRAKEKLQIYWSAETENSILKRIKKNQIDKDINLLKIIQNTL